MELDSNTDAGLKQGLLKYDRIVIYIILAHLPVSAFLLPMGYETQAFALVASLIVGAVAGLAYFFLRGTRLFGPLAGVLLMTLSAIFIQTQLGRIEMHFHIFGALALLLIYRDWLTIVSAAGFIAVHHLLFTALQLNEAQLGGMPIMVYNYGCTWGITFLHAAFVVFEAAFLIYYGIIMRKEQITGMQLIAAVSQVQNSCDLSVRVPDAGDSEVANAFNSMIDNFDQIIGNIHATLDQLAELSTGLLGSSNEANRNISIQHEQISHAVSSMSEMSTAINIVADNAQLAAVAASDADDEASNGARVVEQAVNITKELNSGMSQANESIDLLNKNAESIGLVVDVIRGISEQTNLLALNAAIEAARAGEQGRGFAVVADEVRTLAQRTQESTEEIQNIIESLQNVTGDVVRNIERGQKNSSETAEEIGKTGSALKSIVQAVSRIKDMNTQIASNSEEQSATAQSISENINQISEISVNSVKDIETNQQAAEELQRLADSLKQSISLYRTSAYRSTVSG